MKTYTTLLLLLYGITTTPAFSQRWSSASLSQGKISMSAGAIGDKIMFFSGSTWIVNGQVLLAEAELFDIRTETSEVLSIDPSAKRDIAAAASVGSKIIFAGGDNGWPMDRVDIYDTLTGTWSTAQLSLDRYFISPVSIHNKALFAGGSSRTADRNASNVDVYDLLTNSWTNTNLPLYQGVSELTPYRRNIGGIGYGTKAYFAGGVEGVYEDDASNKVSVYDVVTSTWMPSLTLSNRKHNICTGAYKGKVYFAGGMVFSYDSGTGIYAPSDSMNVFDTLTGNMNVVKIPKLLDYNSTEGKRPWMKSVQSGCKLFLIPQYSPYPNGSADTIAIYDMARDSWAFEALPHPRTNVTPVACKNKVCFAGGLNASYQTPYFYRSEIDIYTLNPILKTAVNNAFTNSYDFGSTEENTLKQITLQLSNEGDYDLLFDPAVTYTLSGDVAAFTIDPASLPGVSDTLAPADILSIPIQFHPAASGVYSATLTLRSNDPLTPVHTFQISGIATAPTSVLNAISSSFIKLYPNPSALTVSIENSGTQVFTKLEIINVQGTLLKQTTITDAVTTLDVSAFVQGVYFVRLSNENTFTVVKMVKE